MSIATLTHRNLGSSTKMEINKSRFGKKDHNNSSSNTYIVMSLLMLLLILIVIFFHKPYNVPIENKLQSMFN